MYSYDTLHEISLLMAMDRNRLLADGNPVPKGSYEPVVCCLWYRVVGFDQCCCVEDSCCWIGCDSAAASSGGDSTSSASRACGDPTAAASGVGSDSTSSASGFRAEGLTARLACC